MYIHLRLRYIFSRKTEEEMNSFLKNETKTHITTIRLRTFAGGSNDLPFGVGTKLSGVVRPVTSIKGNERDSTSEQGSVDRLKTNTRRPQKRKRKVYKGGYRKHAKSGSNRVHHFRMVSRPSSCSASMICIKSN